MTDKKIDEILKEVLSPDDYKEVTSYDNRTKTEYFRKPIPVINRLARQVHDLKVENERLEKEIDPYD